MKKIKYLPIFFLLLYTQLTIANNLNYEYSGEISLQGGGYSVFEEPEYYAGLRILPFFEGRTKLEEVSYLDLNLALNGFSAYREELQNKLKLYRLSLSYQSLQTEFKLGLQKITFGPAKYLRPLMWFDRINPTDPMQITKGVYGVLLRYYTLDNKNIWLWGLYGNDELKGLERFQSEPEHPEIGGRFQVPVPNGEIAASYHGRRIQDNSSANNAEEQRFALDGYFDLGIGLWFESVLSLVSNHKDQFISTIGSDYTFGIGNGLNLVAEFMPIRYISNSKIPNSEENLYALSLSYPLNILDQVMYLTYYSESIDKLFHYLQYQRAYDKYVLNLAVFHYPDIGYDLFTGRESNISGPGLQLMIIYNF